VEDNSARKAHYSDRRRSKTYMNHSDNFLNLVLVVNGASTETSPRVRIVRADEGGRRGRRPAVFITADGAGRGLGAVAGRTLAVGAEGGAAHQWSRGDAAGVNLGLGGRPVNLDGDVDVMSRT